MQGGGVPFEIICVNDGSTDGSRDIVLDMARNHPCLHLLEQDNQGPSAATQAGIRAASGHCLWCVDADDLLHPLALSAMTEVLEKSGQDFAVCEEKRFFPGQDPSGLMGPVPALPPVSSLEWTNRLWGAFHSTLSRREALERSGGCDPRVFVQDYSAFLRLYHTCSGVAVHTPLYFYRADQAAQVSAGRFQQHHDASLAEAFFLLDHGTRVPASFRRRCVSKGWSRLARVARKTGRFSLWLHSVVRQGVFPRHHDPEATARLLFRTCRLFRQCTPVRLTRDFPEGRL